MTLVDWQDYWNGMGLPYWAHLKINHLLDPMHIFKNVAQNIWDHLVGAKDTLAIREDMRSIGQLPNTWPRVGEKGNIVLPNAPWILTNKQQKKVKGSIALFCTPTGYMRSLKGCFTKKKKKGSTKLYGLKTYDWHKMLQV